MMIIHLVVVELVLKIALKKKLNNIIKLCVAFQMGERGRLYGVFV